MTLSVTHSYVSSVGETTPSGGPGGTVGPIEWNANHTLTGTASPAQGGTGITSGLGVTYFSSATVIADSGTLSTNQLVVGGGPNGAPATIGSLGTTSQVLHGNASGNPSFGSVDLGSEVSGTLPVARGGTNSSTIGSSGQIIFNNSGGLAGMSGTSWDNTNLALSITGSTALAASNPIFNLTQGWNAAGVTFTALKLNVTNTASAASSLLMDLQIAGSSLFNFGKNGVFDIATALTGTPTTLFQIGGVINFQPYTNATGNILLISGLGNSPSPVFGGMGNSVGGIYIANQCAFGWGSSNIDPVSTCALVANGQQVGLFDPASHSTACAFQVYNTTDTNINNPTNYERGVFDWTTTTNVLTIGTQKGGTGSTRNLVFVVGNATKLDFGVTNNQWSLQNSLIITNGNGSNFNIGIGNYELRSHVNAIIGWSAGDPASQTQDTALSRIVAGVIGFGNGSLHDTSAFIQWGGQARVSGNVTSTTTSLANITGLTATLANGRNYSFNCEVIGTCSSSGGVQLALNTTSTSTGYTLLIDGYAIDGGNSVRGYSQQTAVGTAVIASTITNTSFHASLWGTITTSSSMVVNFQMAQQNLSATQTIAQRGSHSFFHDMP